MTSRAAPCGMRHRMPYRLYRHESAAAMLQYARDWSQYEKFPRVPKSRPLSRVRFICGRCRAQWAHCAYQELDEKADNNAGLPLARRFVTRGSEQFRAG